MWPIILFPIGCNGVSTDRRLKRNETYGWWVWLAVALCIPAFVINIDNVPFIGDEAIRAIVAYEMMLSGNYLVPKINGEFYFSKPPLYNWVLICFYRVFGVVSELSSRIPTVIFTVLFTYVIYLFNKRRFIFKKHSVLLALMFLTCGRMIFYDSFLGLIDIFFSMVTYTMIIGTYVLASKDKWQQAYFLMCILSAVGFMLKGLPTIHFFIFNILCLHITLGQWKKIMSWGMVAGFLTGGLLLGTYFFFYNNYITAKDAMAPLLEEAAIRTVAKNEWSDVFKHILTYPFENIYHFLPWSIFGILAIRKDIVAILKSNKYIWYCTLSALTNYMVYWTSAEVFPRYILMLIPLIFTIWIFLYEFEVQDHHWRLKTLRILFKGIAFTIPFVIALGIFNSKIDLIAYWEIKMLIIVSILALVSYYYFVNQPLRPILLVIMILVLRIGFDIFVLPVRAMHRDSVIVKSESIRIAKKYGPNIKIYGSSSMNRVNSIYMMMENEAILSHDSSMTLAPYYIIDSTYLENFNTIDTFPNGEGATMWVIEAQ
ncbi:MAG TPA: glycosyltransferase family 39 protein [Saprospiraceae bacterium]|nr:glycosyltransferase family 39 protein [Saprospiraceae bacterium]